MATVTGGQAESVAYQLDRLGHPPTAGLPGPVCELLAEDLTTVAIAMREQANLWRAANAPGLETVIVAFTEFADRLAQRARTYRLTRSVT